MGVFTVVCGDCHVLFDISRIVTSVYGSTRNGSFVSFSLVNNTIASGNAVRPFRYYSRDQSSLAEGQ